MDLNTKSPQLLSGFTREGTIEKLVTFKLCVLLLEMTGDFTMEGGFFAFKGKQIALMTFVLVTAWTGGSVEGFAMISFLCVLLEITLGCASSAVMEEGFLHLEECHVNQ